MKIPQGLQGYSAIWHFSEYLSMYLWHSAMHLDALDLLLSYSGYLLQNFTHQSIYLVHIICVAATWATSLSQCLHLGSDLGCLQLSQVSPTGWAKPLCIRYLHATLYTLFLPSWYASFGPRLLSCPLSNAPDPSLSQLESHTAWKWNKITKPYELLNMLKGARCAQMCFKMIQKPYECELTVIAIFSKHFSLNFNSFKMKCTNPFEIFTECC